MLYDIRVCACACCLMDFNEMWFSAVRTGSISHQIAFDAAPTAAVTLYSKLLLAMAHKNQYSYERVRRPLRTHKPSHLKKSFGAFHIFKHSCLWNCAKEAISKHFLSQQYATMGLN